MRHDVSARQRALGAFYGMAIGDALGMPSQQMSREQVQAALGPIEGFRDGPPANSISAGMPAGMITDDTEQALIIAELLVEGRGAIDVGRLAARLRAWERLASARGGEQLGPSTRRAIEALDAGVPLEQVGLRGDTNGAAMRIAPVGVAFAPEPLGELVSAVAGASRLTHNTGLAISGAAAVAAVVSIGVAGGDMATAVERACSAAELGLCHGGYSAGASIARRIRFAVELAESPMSDEVFARELADLVGTGVTTQEAVPAAFALVARWPDDHWQACCVAASAGGDTDTVGAIAGAMIGAHVGLAGLRPEAVDQVRAVNELRPERLVESLLELRGISDE
jgi:ADP-ribosylglycohydrolase